MPDVPDEPDAVHSAALVVPRPQHQSAEKSVWTGCGHVWGTGLAVLYGRTTDDPAVLRASAAAAVAMAELMESGGPWWAPATTGG